MKKKSKSRRKNHNDNIDQETDETFYFVAGYTSGGVAYGTTMEEIVSQELNFRVAAKSDSKTACELMHLAIGDIAEKLTGQTKPENIRETLAFFFCENNNRISYQNTIVADVLDEVAGIVISYQGDDASVLDEPILNRLRKKRRNQEIYFDKEADAGDYYIDTISVAPKFQGYGIGTTLIKKAEEAAKQSGFYRVSLNVARGNSEAHSLYKKLGYHEEKVIHINGHQYDYMVKILEE
ncbi:GNAT family N-acetyltransferase [Bacillus sp. DNRA2]|uniref:GNAT family N-acetyltransferase n=1 Tax=Bacillus sp. DNRA2 TaxID=2723053 RepID=UPI002006ECE9|nr:GNAT family N-acetyltransferase [Bacillus sp. DNRA2]